MIGNKSWLVGIVVVAAACTVENDDDPFGSATSVSAGSATNQTTAGTSSDSGSESGTGDTGSATTSTSTTTDGSTSAMTTMPASDSSDGGSTTTMGGDGGQPTMGMYSHCLSGNDCTGGGVNLCITDENMTDGFCTTTGCTNPAQDCPPSPGGTATPMCSPVTVNMMDEMACALDCSNMKTCPTGMVCMSFQQGTMCM